MDRELLPNIIIAGVVKGGTTSLYTYLSNHPDICPSAKKETDFFMPLIHGNELPSILEYKKYFKNYKGEKYIMDASPRYMHGGRAIVDAIHDHLGEIKIIFILRDPIDKLFSFYKHMKRGLEIKKQMNFDDYVSYSLRQFNDSKDVDRDMYKNIFILALVEGFYTKFLKEWFSVFGNLINIYFFNDLKKDPYLLMVEICMWLGIDPSFYTSYSFNIENKGFLYKNMILQKFAMYINNKLEVFFRRNQNIKRLIRDAYYFINEETSNKETISYDTHKLLESFYKPYNVQLLEMLKSEGYSKMPDWVINESAR